MAEKDYASALYYFDRGIEKLPRSKEMLYKRAVCKHELGNTEGACNDLKNLQRLGDQSAAALMTKWCN
jgi:TolA-binding protein